MLWYLGPLSKGIAWRKIAVSNHCMMLASCFVSRREEIELVCGAATAVLWAALLADEVASRRLPSLAVGTILVTQQGSGS